MKLPKGERVGMAGKHCFLCRKTLLSWGGKTLLLSSGDIACLGRKYCRISCRHPLFQFLVDGDSCPIAAAMVQAMRGMSNLPVGNNKKSVGE